MNSTPDHFALTAPLAWVTVAAVLAIAEILLPSFGTMFLSLGAVAAAAVAYAGADLVYQIGAFIVVSLTSMALLRRHFIAWFGRGRAGVPSRTDVLLGKQGIVTQTIEPTGEFGGRVTVDGQDWAAVAAEKIPAGTSVKIESADGIVLKVSRT